MTTQQPPDPNQTRSGDERTGASPDRPDDTAGRRSRKPVVIAAVAVVIAGAIAGTLLLNKEDEQPKERTAAPPMNGLSCPYLLEAADAYKSGDHAAFESAIAQAKDVAEGTLQTSGQAFGKPERIALELGLGDVSDPTRLLDDARAACLEETPPSSS